MRVKFSFEIVLNSRAGLTVCAIVRSSHNRAVALAPSGASRGAYEAQPYIPNLKQALLRAKKLAKKSFRFEKFEDLEKIEKTFAPAGANPVVAAQFALLKLWSIEHNQPIFRLLSTKPKFPRILANVVGGGAHAAKKFDIQEILICPKVRAPDALFVAAEIYRKLKNALLRADKNFLGAKTDEGAWATSLPATKALELVKRLCAGRADLGIDLAASQLYDGKNYVWQNYSGSKIAVSPAKHRRLLQKLIDRYKLFYLEDPFAESDFNSFSALQKANPRLLVCGDDLTCTNPARLKRALKNACISAIILKPNQIGGLIKTAHVLKLAKKAGLKTVLSHRSGDSCDSVLAHLALGWGTDFVKFGIAGGERTSKLNELLLAKKWP